jgi:hypothetical protein
LKLRYRSHRLELTKRVQGFLQSLIKYFCGGLGSLIKVRFIEEILYVFLLLRFKLLLVWFLLKKEFIIIIFSCHVHYLLFERLLLFSKQLTPGCYRLSIFQVIIPRYREEYWIPETEGTISDEA